MSLSKVMALLGRQRLTVFLEVVGYMHVESQIRRPKMSDDVPFPSTLGQHHDLGEFPMWCRFLQ